MDILDSSLLDRKADALDWLNESHWHGVKLSNAYGVWVLYDGDYRVSDADLFTAIEKMSQLKNPPEREDTAPPYIDANQFIFQTHPWDYSVIRRILYGNRKPGQDGLNKATVYLLSLIIEAIGEQIRRGEEIEEVFMTIPRINATGKKIGVDTDSALQLFVEKKYLQIEFAIKPDGREQQREGKLFKLGQRTREILEDYANEE